MLSLSYAYIQQIEAEHQKALVEELKTMAMQAQKEVNKQKEQALANELMAREQLAIALERLDQLVKKK